MFSTGPRSRQIRPLTKPRQSKDLNNIVEQDQRRIMRLVRLGIGFKSYPTARRVIAGYAILAMVRKGQIAA
ncbi:DDE-type integrase/transposase/recombinase [Azospirillum brasilense]|uniref:DDE-type integrase/transposase/recombinase n=1 Tax=Azospirillum brasilense TaxID=192 RepID=UPI0003AA2864|nr:DDE-type integrase/transposase/recombinase [Azospirillum brasilense]PWC84797.1 hypothetical protein AEJ54_29160 [Azospirillum sp. Sp 7]